MKKTSLLFLLALSIMGFEPVYSQEQLNHPSRFHKSEDGKLYVNRNQPMYLYLSSSPVVGGEMERLESESSARYANPFYFDSDGYNSIRTPWRVDTITKQVVYPLEDVIFEVYADGTPPKTNVTFNNARKFTHEGKTYYGSGLTIDLSATDATSGVDQTLFSLNSEDYRTYNGPVSINDEGEYYLRFYSVDNVGNIEEVSVHHFFVDTTPPVGNWTLEGDVYQNTASANSKIIILGTDNLSGIKEIRYQINDNPIRKYSDGISLSDLPSNNYTLNYWIEDNVGNIFEGSDGNVEVVQTFTVDRSPPKTFASIIGDHHQGDILYLSDRSKIELDANDTISGVRNIIFGFNNSRILNEIYLDPISPLSSNGNQTIYFQAFDMVANRSVVEEFSFYLDIEPPLTYIDFSGPQFFTRDTLFINKNTSINLISKDNASGVQSTEYKVNGADFVKGNQFQLKNSGIHSIEFRSTDMVNNQEQTKKSLVYVDNEPPEIHVNFSIQAIGEELIDNDLLKIYPPYVRMYIGATDKHCGTENIYFSINGGERIKYEGINSPAARELFTEEMIYHVLVYANDKLGNETTKEIRFKISN
ncbi:OmpL47-type beta-barrel domain-containing protein [Alkalitalea saponilacus]|uniref:Ig-like domain (Group 3) n=1 Tax=Alkalitalea saponilacus TaxID=889453 RepID=A0A1T5HSE4_9BACT|nr:hypothetical protein [Alkalitalea saponilacus]ASB48377.1 hypothetical protein CDL62_04075 [Alkalitalea saponilacus]SKC23609.1 hypothetical protein SAMN03080601_02887 [Alkalitalea saponilacus]